MRSILVALLVVVPGIAFTVPLEEVYSPFDSGRDEVGVRALGMGGAFVALADDLTAVEWNPSGLSQLSGFHFQGEGSMVAMRASGEIHRFKRVWDPGYTNFIPPESRGTGMQADFVGFGSSYGRAPWNFFSALTWARTREGRRDDRFYDPVNGMETGVVQNGGLYHLTASHAVGWHGRWHAGFAVHGIPFGALEGIFTQEGQEDVPYAKIFKGDPSFDGGILLRPLGGALEGWRIGATYQGPCRMTFNYSDAWVDDFDADYLQTSRLSAGTSGTWRAWRISFQWEKDFDSELEDVRKSTYAGGFPTLDFPVRYFDVVNLRGGAEWRPALRLGALRNWVLCAGYASRDRGYQLRPESFLEADRDRVASFGSPRGSMLTWGFAAESLRWTFRISGQSEEVRYERKTRTLRWRFGIGARF